MIENEYVIFFYFYFKEVVGRYFQGGFGELVLD